MALTKYPEGSVRELWSIAFPLMLASLSILAMVFVDRLFLAHYSESALSAGVTAGTASWAILGSLVILASMSEVFVAQYNGAKRFDQIGRPVWQMIWFSVGSLMFLIPLAVWGKLLLFHNNPNFELEREYFQWLTIFGFSWPLLGAMAAFFVGRGKTRLIMTLSIVANGINVLLDWVLIFGIDGVIPSMGMTGAALATSFGNIIQVCIMLPIFLSRPNRERYGTAQFKFYWREFRKCLKIGVPPATLFFVECMGFALFYMMIAATGEQQIFVAGIAQSVLILFFFIAEGIGRGAAAVSGNFIGGARHGHVYKVFRSGLKLQVIFFGIASIFLVIFPNSIITLFMNKELAIVREGGVLEADALHMLEVTFRICLFYLLFEGIRWLVSGILTSAGDTLFLLVVGIVTVPLALLLPTYLVIHKWPEGIEGAFLVSVEFSFVVATIFLWRLFSEKWQRIQLIS